MCCATADDGSVVASCSGAPALLGREPEVAHLTRCLEIIAGGGSACIALAGQPGIGKTALLREARARGLAVGTTVAAGRGTEFERELPFGVFVHALDELIGARSELWEDDEGSGARTALARVFPSLAGGDDASPTLQSERFRFHHAVRGALAMLARDGPLMLVVDDAHWTDDASVELLAYLLRHGLPDGVLLLLAYRPSQAPPLLSRAVAEAARDGLVTLREVPPLSERDAVELLGSDLDVTVRRALYRDTGGNPFYLTELARLDGQRLGDPSAPATVPASVQAAIAQELRDVSAWARGLVAAAAVVGDPFDLGLAATVATLDERSVLPALDELLVVGLVRPSETPAHFAFRHPIVRRAVYASIAGGSRVRAHRRAAEALTARGASLTSRAHHVERSARAGDDEAIALLGEAARAAVPLAPATAARWFGAALRLLPADAPVPQRLELLIPLATAQGTTGQVEASQRTLTGALALLPRDQVVLKAGLVGAIARLDHMLARHSDTRALLEDALADARPAPSAGSAALWLELAMDHWYADEWSAAAAAAAHAHADAEAVGDRLVAATALALEGLVRSHLGDLDAARPLVDAAAHEVDLMADAELADRIEALVVLADAEFSGVESARDSLRHAERGIAISRATGQDTWFLPLMVRRCAASTAIGRLDEAYEAADDAVESSRLVHDQPLRWALAMRSSVDRVRGDLDAAVHHGEQAIAVDRGSSGGPLDWRPYTSLALALLETGDPARARDLILTHAGGPGLERVERGWMPHWYRVLCQAEVADGDLGAAERWAGRAENAAAGFPTPGRRAEGACARASIDLAAGRPHQAAAAALDAAKLYEAAEWTIDAARARVLAGHALAEVGDAARAVELLRRAHTTLDVCGATRYRAEAAQALRRLGERVSTEHVSTPGAEPAGDALSRREREVAGLVARGMTNREIAEALFVSHKTVESHLSRIFGKLGVPTRAALAAAIARDAAS